MLLRSVLADTSQLFITAVAVAALPSAPTRVCEWPLVARWKRHLRLEIHWGEQSCVQSPLYPRNPTPFLALCLAGLRSVDGCQAAQCSIPTFLRFTSVCLPPSNTTIPTAPCMCLSFLPFPASTNPFKEMADGDFFSSLALCVSFLFFFFKTGWVNQSVDNSPESLSDSVKRNTKCPNYSPKHHRQQQQKKSTKTNKHKQVNNLTRRRCYEFWQIRVRGRLSVLPGWESANAPPARGSNPHTKKKHRSHADAIPPIVRSCRRC